MKRTLLKEVARLLTRKKQILLLLALMLKGFWEEMEEMKAEPFPSVGLQAAIILANTLLQEMFEAEHRRQTPETSSFERIQRMLAQQANPNMLTQGLEKTRSAAQFSITAIDFKALQDNTPSARPTPSMCTQTRLCVFHRSALTHAVKPLLQQMRRDR